jgi:BirA family transcriptional regulator, biotin operon repressor / biotin---[acetyl-CoA-carboxylase] ligase
VTLGRPRLHLRETTSTNDRARELAAAGAPHGTLVTAAAQSAGRGRQGRTWSAPEGHALLMSLVLRGAHPLLPLAAGVAVADAIGSDARIKWPNDVLIDGRKVAGILAEGRPQEGWAVLGIGLNVSAPAGGFPEELREIAASLNGALSRHEVLAALLERLEARLASPLPEVLAEWRRRDALLGQRVGWDGGHGVAAGIDADGSLLVDTDAGRVALIAGEVHLRRT